MNARRKPHEEEEMATRRGGGRMDDMDALPREGGMAEFEDALRDQLWMRRGIIVETTGQREYTQGIGSTYSGCFSLDPGTSCESQ